MGVTKKGGHLGKACIECRQWKPLIEFDFDRRPGMFKGYRKAACKTCLKAKQK